MKSLFPNAVSACALGLLAGLAASVSLAAEPVAVVRVEEDWQLVISSTDANSTAPQVTCAISPTQNVDALHATFELNHHSQPQFVPGGLQLQLWDNEIPLDSRPHPSLAVLATDSETIRWTQSMYLVGDVLTFEVSNGSSTTWGTFGGEGKLRAATTTQLSNLNGYDPTTSAKQSGVGYAANRVGKLVLKQVRLLTDSGVVLEDATERMVWEHN